MNFLRVGRAAAAVHEIASFSAISAPIRLRVAVYCLVDAHTADGDDTILLISVCQPAGIGMPKQRRQARRRGGSGGGGGGVEMSRGEARAPFHFNAIYTSLVMLSAQNYSGSSNVMCVVQRLNE